MMELTRFLAVTVAGFLLDLGVAWSAATVLSLPLWFAATLGFVVAAGVNYVLHELWTFQDGAQRLSLERVVRYAAGLGLTLSARILAVLLFTAMLNENHALLILLAGAGVSFIVNYFVSRKFVFRPEGDAKRVPVVTE